MSKIRITHGTLKNLQLDVSKDTKALSEIAKLATFSMIGDTIDSSSCLDLFAGSGNLGIESISRGSKKVIFVENSPYAIKTIYDNLKNAQNRVGDAKKTYDNQDLLTLVSNIKHKTSKKYEETYKEIEAVADTEAQISKKDATDYVANDHEHYDVIYMDPPYGQPVKHLLKLISNIMHKKSLLFFYHHKNDIFDYPTLNPKIKLLSSKNYGITTVDLLSLI